MPRGVARALQWIVETRQFCHLGTLFLNDLHVLDLPAIRWSALAAAGGSVPRGRCQSVMVAAPNEEIVLVFGGACHHEPKPGQAYGDMVMDLCDVALDAFAQRGPVVLGLDDTIERRRGKRIAAKGIYRDLVRSSDSHFVKASGLRWMSLMVLALIPWAGRVWAVLAHTPRQVGSLPHLQGGGARVRGRAAVQSAIGLALGYGEFAWIS